MAIQKKHGKGRLDKWYKLAKEKGYRARAAFKLIQLNKKYGFLEKSKVLLDLCAAPGSWCQVAAETMPQNSLIVGVDLAPIKPIPRVITFQSDITTEKCRATIRSHLKTWKADTVLHDGAPNVGTSWVQDSFNQAELALQSMKLATEFLIEGGTFVTKVFRSKEYNKLLWVFNQLFAKVEATKPPSSRNVSAEIFVVCRGFKAPKHLDPRFLDPRAVFAELADAAPNNEAKVFNPEVKKRKRDGYEEGDYTQFKELPASDFIETIDPIAILGSYNKLSFEQPKNGNVALAALDKMPETTEDIRLACKDLKVLGRKEFKMLLKWRLKAREAFGLPTKKTTAAAKSATDEGEQAEVESMDEELKIQEELQAMKDKESAKKRRERRRENEKKQKEIVRMQLHMTAPMDIGLEQVGPQGQDSMFNLKQVDKHGATNKIAKGKMALLKQNDQKDQDSGIGSSLDAEDESDDEEDRLERELDNMFDQYRERKAEADTKYRAKKARQEHKDDEWEGVSGDEQQSSDDDEELEQDSSDDSDDDEDDESSGRPLVTDLDGTANGPDGLSKRAKNFFNQDIFKGMEGILDEAEEEPEDDDDDDEIMEDLDRLAPKKAPKPTVSEKKSKSTKSKKEASDAPELDSDDEEGGFETVKEDVDDWEDEGKRKEDGTLDIDIITAEAMTLAHQLATGQKSNYDLMDDGFNKHAFRDRDGLPEWFVDDEGKHDKPHKPITKAAADAIKEKLRAYNARPIKKVREAKARKKFKAAQRLEKLKKKSDMLANEEGMTEKEKADSITKLLAKAAKKKPRVQPKLVVARGLNRGIKGRPKGVKGRYKIVDPRMKKELRAMKRVNKKK
ncbi:AdoMet-dependent rRNA methyltransferase spb-1 [Microdochium trichocladiopsis]|uniref:AdoMet-dependent rRNA methyltransferase spb-1 n=1 Tax=Microdochium trichocladiopsis TaxID=1682393 RepID=A0A9P8Y8V6_9PEZI|nr:AdoMet-dependent rRNA methyltransferase spb-1 [Microdochium trichocladiopsis]KAH7033242.1 AdoMet-dependent rRNA methyltransferase spb-1 [Microdochium trichocladiopsis]